MEKELLNSAQVQDFLQDFESTAKLEILEDAKEQSEIFEIAQARGINLKESKDLAGFKCVYCFADIANKNKARLPKKALLKALPTLVGKPVDIDHLRNRVVGVLIDSRYIVKDDKVIAYGILFKANFPEDWSVAEKKFKDGKLSVSYEIFCPQNKRKQNADGTYSLEEQIIAGMAILFDEEPAFTNAKVLELAKDNNISKDLVFASYCCKDIIINGESKCSNCGNCKHEEHASEVLETVKVEPKVEVKPDVVPVTPIPVVIPKIKCANCQHEFEAPKVPTSEIKCSECFAIINDKGELLYPPQIIDFNISCPNCSSRNWRLLKKEDKTAEIKCLSCAKKFGIEFSSITKNELLDKIQFLHEGMVSCKQCGNTIIYSGSSHMQKYDLKCKRCGLAFSHDVTHEQIKKLSKIEEISSKADELKIDKSAIKEEAKGEVTMEKQEEQVVDQTTKPVEVAKVEEAPKVETTPQAESVVAEAKPVEAKVEEAPKVEEKPIEAKVEDKKEEPKPEEAKVEIPKVEEVKPVEIAQVEEKKEEAKAEEKVEEKKKEETKEEKKWKKWTKGVRKIAKKVKDMKKCMKEKEKECASTVEFYKVNAEEISKRRKELGEEGKNLTDREILEDSKFSDAKLVKANKDLETSSIVGLKTNEHSEEWYAKHRQEIDDKAFGRKERTH